MPHENQRTHWWRGKGHVDYLIFDYLAEVTMSILARARKKSPALGYARDFIDLVMKPLLPQISAQGVRVVVNAGAQVAITGRCVDSALVLGPLIHEFGWQPDDYDRLAAGSLAGHIIECGAQATGGNFTDWQQVASHWDDMGYPIAVCQPDGTFIIAKPSGTGGVVSRLSVGEQLLYEIGDPSSYLLPDVVCDFTQVSLEESGEDELTVRGVRGRAPTPTLKVSATWIDGFRATSATVVTGFDAVAKAHRCADALLSRLGRLMRERQLAEWRRPPARNAGSGPVRLSG